MVYVCYVGVAAPVVGGDRVVVVVLVAAVVVADGVARLLWQSRRSAPSWRLTELGSSAFKH